jgi:hypothetical protein
MISAAEFEKLNAQISQFVMERDFLSKAFSLILGKGEKTPLKSLAS